MLPPWRDVSSSPLPFCQLDCLSPGCEFFVCSGHQTLVPVITGKCVFPYSWSPFHFANGSFAMQQLVILMESHLSIVSFVTLAWPKGENPGEKIAVWSYLRVSCLSSAPGLLWYDSVCFRLLSF